MKQKQKPGGFTLIDFLIVIAVLAALFVVCLPVLIHTQPRAPRIVCVNNLKQVGLGFRIWATDHNNQMPMTVSLTNGGAMEAALAGNVAAVFQVMSNELNTPKVLFCPTDQKRMQATTFDLGVAGTGVSAGISFLNNSNATYFVGLDATDLLPDGFLSGDDNFLVGGQRDDLQSGLSVSPGILTLTTNSLIAWSKARHERQGNVGLADGSVQSYSSAALRRALVVTRDWAGSGEAKASSLVTVQTNRLIIP